MTQIAPNIHVTAGPRAVHVTHSAEGQGGFFLSHTLLLDPPVARRLAVAVTAACDELDELDPPADVVDAEILEAGPPVGMTVNDWVVIRLALETQQRVMEERQAWPAAEAARLLRLKLALEAA